MLSLLPPRHHRRAFIAWVAILIAFSASSAPAQDWDIEGFTEPFREIELATGEAGIVRQIFVKVGDHVRPGQAVAQLDQEVHKQLLEIAKHQYESRGELLAAEAEVRLRQRIVEELSSLQAGGFAPTKELIQAKNQLESAQSMLLARQETQALRKLQFEKAKIDLQRRTIYASTTGLVSKLHREPGEYLSTVNPEVITVVQIDPMLAVFNVSSHVVQRMHVGQKQYVRFSDGTRIDGIIQTIGVVTDAESGTVEVKIQLANPKGALRVGEQCSLVLGLETIDEKSSPNP